MKWILSQLSLSYPSNLVYMLQITEYDLPHFLKWWLRVKNFSAVSSRGSLVKTSKAKLLVVVLHALRLFLIISLIIIFTSLNDNVSLLLAGLAVSLLYVVAPVSLLCLIITLARPVTDIKTKKAVEKASKTFANHPGLKIAVAGSYGKTSVKELLLTVLGTNLTVAASPANRNVVSSHVVFASRLIGNEDVVIVEYGEAKPGDIDKLARLSKPDIGIITGLAPAHLDNYGTLANVADDLMSLANFVEPENLYINSAPPAIRKYIKPNFQTYNNVSGCGWSVSHLKIDYSGMKFKIKKDDTILDLSTGLIGEHLIGPLVLCAVIALKLGLSNQAVEAAIALTRPYEHRMQPKSLGGAWIIDDTYNGTIEGMTAGLKLMGQLPAKRKWYVTPGLVEQGAQTEAIHNQLGELIAQAAPDRVVLMKNTVTPFIQAGLERGGYGGIVSLEGNPLNFYLNLDQFIVDGDLIMMQNDWSDNYA